MKHTFGDWKSYGAVVLCPRGYVVAAVSEPGYRSYRVPELDGKDWGEVIANRNLIAAAPDLLAALEAVEWVPTSDPNWVRCEWCGIVRFKPEQSLTHKPDCQRQAAIAKAKEQP